MKTRVKVECCLLVLSICYERLAWDIQDRKQRPAKSDKKPPSVYSNMPAHDAKAAV